MLHRCPLLGHHLERCNDPMQNFGYSVSREIVLEFFVSLFLSLSNCLSFYRYLSIHRYLPIDPSIHQFITHLVRRVEQSEVLSTQIMGEFS